MFEINLILFAILIVYLDYAFVRHGYKKSRYTSTSSFNPVAQLDGKRWSSANELHNKYGNKKIYIGDFRYTPKVEKDVLFMPIMFKKYILNTKIYLDPKDHLRKTTILYGGMGSGKSTAFINILDQPRQYDNCLVHDGGKNEMVSRYYSRSRDIIANLYDERATVIDILDHDPLVAGEFFKLMLMSTNKDSSFFTKGSLEHFQNIVFLTNSKKFENKKQKWNFFIEKIEELITNTLEESQKSELDVISTLKQQMTIFLLMNFRIQNDAKTINLSDFLDRKKAAKLYISYPDNLKGQMQSYSAGIVYLYIMVLLSKPDTTEYTRLLAIDEFSSFLRLINYDSNLLKDILEKPRSKGGCIIAGLQGVEEKKEINSVIQKTCHQKFYFRTDGNETKQQLIEDVGKTTYEVHNKTKGDNGDSRTVQTKQDYLIKLDDFEELGNRHEFLAQIGDDLFRAYTPLPFTSKQKKLKSEGYIEFKLRKEFDNYLAQRYEDFQAKRAAKNKAKKIADKATKNT